MVVFADRVLDVVTLKLYSLLSAGNGVHKECVIILRIFIIKLVLIHNVLIFPDEVVDVMLSFSVALDISRAGEESDDYTREEM